MASGYKKNGTDLDDLFEPIGGYSKIDDVNYHVGGVDVANRWAPASVGLTIAATGYERTGTDLGLLFAGKDTTYQNRGLFSGGFYDLQINMISIASLGNAADFGDLIYGNNYGCASVSNGTSGRGISGKGWNAAYGGGYSTYLEYVTINTLSDALFSGHLVYGVNEGDGLSNGTGNRAVFAGGKIGSSPVVPTNTMDYKTISNTGNCAHYGYLIASVYALSGCSNGTGNRGLFAGGWNTSETNQITYITITSTGNSIDNGNLSVARMEHGSTSNGTNNRAIWIGGTTSLNSDTSTIDYRTITSTGNASYMSALTLLRTNVAGVSNGTGNRGVFAGGWHRTWGANVDTMDYITISTGGTCYDFGNLISIRSEMGGMSNS
jgi:hypothetical protein